MTEEISDDEYVGDDPSKIWTPGDREFYYNLPTNDPITGYVDSCSMYVDLSSRRLFKLKISRYVKSNFYLIITHLHLQNNKLTELPERLFSDLENLAYLNASNNDLRSFPKTVKNHEGLVTILLRDNLIEEFPLELGSIPGLKTLEIEYNPSKFPSFATVKQWRRKKDVVDYFRRCWKAQSKTLPATEKKVNRVFKPKKPKYFHVKEPSEIICGLKRSRDPKLKKKAVWMENQLQARENELKKIKDRKVLKEWRDNYRLYQNEERTVTLQPPPYGIDDRYNRIAPKSVSAKIDAEKKSVGYKLNLDHEIANIKERLANISIDRKYKDPEGEMAARIREMKMIRQLQKKIEHLKYRA
ncbi:unnamed protein product [Nesidiocoris tenuis]|uniref:Leucine-rich repeat-containing protein 27 n=1 Tax=Nesidiocoris tenuis TaxID=355587 RepID=A0A6H5FW09_9HEMI|nr:unnamed protein product [Nesidiocoris tenuis]